MTYTPTPIRDGRLTDTQHGALMDELYRIHSDLHAAMQGLRTGPDEARPLGLPSLDYGAANDCLYTAFRSVSTALDLLREQRERWQQVARLEASLETLKEAATAAAWPLVYLTNDQARDMMREYAGRLGTGAKARPVDPLRWDDAADDFMREPS